MKMSAVKQTSLKLVKQIFSKSKSVPERTSFIIAQKWAVEILAELSGISVTHTHNVFCIKWRPTIDFLHVTHTAALW